MMPAEMRLRHAWGGSAEAPGTIRHGFGQPKNMLFSKEKCIRAGSAAVARLHRPFPYLID